MVIGEKDGVRPKPAPDTVLEALRALGMTPEKAIYVGDSEVDIETGKERRNRADLGLLGV